MKITDEAVEVNEDALRALAQAYDREDAAQRGESDPWNLDDPGDIGDSDTWVSERIACARAAAEAFLSTLTMQQEDLRHFMRKAEAAEARIAELVKASGRATGATEWTPEDAYETVYREMEKYRFRAAALERALKFYADVSKYPAPLTGGMGDLWFDCGERARAALASTGGQSNE